MTKGLRPSDIPVTQGMLYGVRDELKADIRSLEAKMDSKFERVISEVHRIGVLVEEQNARNATALDALYWIIPSSGSI